MAINTTRWSPDTCGCVVEYTWDSTVPQASRTHSLGTVIAKCPAHTALTDSAVYAALTDENPRKNLAYDKILSTFPSLTQTILNPDGATTVTLKNGIIYSWSFDVNRVLNVSVTGLTTTQKNTLQSACDTQFGIGKVKVI